MCICTSSFSEQHYSLTEESIHNEHSNEVDDPLPGLSLALDKEGLGCTIVGLATVSCRYKPWSIHRRRRLREAEETPQVPHRLEITSMYTNTDFIHNTMLPCLASLRKLSNEVLSHPL